MVTNPTKSWWMMTLQFDENVARVQKKSFHFSKKIYKIALAPYWFKLIKIVAIFREIFEEEGAKLHRSSVKLCQHLEILKIAISVLWLSNLLKCQLIYRVKFRCSHIWDAYLLSSRTEIFSMKTVKSLERNEVRKREKNVGLWQDESFIRRRMSLNLSKASTLKDENNANL